MTKHDLAWFQDRKGKDIVRIYKDNETVVTILKDKSDDYAKYFHDLQDEGFTFRDTGANIVAASFADPFEDDAPAVSSKLVIHNASDEIGCQSCSA